MLLRSTMKKLAVTFFAAVFVLVSLVPAEGTLRSVRTRALDTPDIVIKPYANMSFGTLLTQSILRATIINGDAATHLKIVLSIYIDTEGDEITDWDGGMDIIMERAIDAGARLTIDNADIFSNFLAFQEDYEFDFENESFGEEGSPYPGGLGEVFDFSSGGNIDASTFLSIVLPEGEYEMTIMVFDVDEDSVNPKGEETVTFKVVDIGNITNLSTPTVQEPKAGWVLPQVPIYNISSYTTTSTVTITGTVPSHEKGLAIL